MKDYVADVGAMDARHRRRLRLLTLAGSAILIATALWAGGFRFGMHDLAEWRRSIADWFRAEPLIEKDARYAIAPQLPTPSVLTSDQTSTLVGTESSISMTPLPLVLISTSPGRNVHEGTARLGTHPENPQTYTAGALLANGSRLLEIHDRFVVLEREGKRVNLYQGNDERNTAKQLALVGGDLNKAPMDLKPTYTEALTDYIRPSPIYDDMSIRGYQVYAGQRAGVFSQLGLQNGDVILSLNDQPFIEPRQAMELFGELMSGVAMNAVVEREGARKRISLDGSIISRDQETLQQASVESQPAIAPPQM